MSGRKTRVPQDWHDVAALLGKPPVKIPRKVTARVDQGALARLRQQIETDRARGLIQKEEAK